MTTTDPLLLMPPETMIQHPARSRQRFTEQAVDFALTYSRAGGTDLYDDLAFRYLAACPGPWQIPLETLANRVATKRRAANLRLPARVASLVDQGPYLAHRPVALPNGRLTFEVRDNLLHTAIRDGGDGHEWILPLGAPGPEILSMAAAQDVLRHAPTDRFIGYWLPVAELLRAGCFPRMQSVREQLVNGIRPGHLAVFISHRWQTPGAPDPEGEQANIVGRRMIQALCEAVRTAAQRGLHAPRLVSASIAGMPVGPAGSPLAEAIIVNVLREALDEAALAVAAEEAERLEFAIGESDDDGGGGDGGGYQDSVSAGSSAGVGDDQGSAGSGLEALRLAVGAAPAIEPLLRRIHLWYDYSCMPQQPRDDADERLFQGMLANLDPVEACGPILVLFDDEIDYLGRAWCHREAALAAQLAIDGVSTVSKADRPGTAPLGTDLQRLVIDRQLVAWRGALDTRVLSSQTPEECMRRLGLAATVPADLPLLYETLLTRGAPRSGVAGPKSLVTGVFPLPSVGRGDVLAPPLDYQATVSVRERRDQPIGVGIAKRVGSLDSWSWLAMTRTRVRAVDEEERTSWRVLSDASDVPNAPGVPRGCHLMVVGSCEAEAVFIAATAARRRGEVEALFGAPVQTVSWLSIDPAPVGVRPDGKLRSMPVDADCWILVGTSGTLSAEPVSAVVDLLQDAGVPVFAVFIDGLTDNVYRLWPERPADEPEDVRERLRTRRVLLVGTDGGQLPRHERGLFLMDFSRNLLQPGAPRD